MEHIKSWIWKGQNYENKISHPISLYHLRDNINLNTNLKNDGYKNSQSSSVRFVPNWEHIDKNLTEQKSK